MKPTRPYVIGVMGGSGTGKTHFSKYLQKYLGAAFINGDETGHQVLNQPEVISRIKERFGTRVFANDKIDRKRLGTLVFEDQEALKDLNAIVHPAIYKSIDASIKSSDKAFIVVEAAVLVKGGLLPLVDILFWIKADDQIRLERLVERRGIDPGRAKNMISASTDDFDRYSDYVIDTTLGIEAIQEDINNILDRIKETADEVLD